MSRQAKATDDSILVWLLGADDQEPLVSEEILKTLIDDIRIIREPAEFLSCVSELSGYQLFVVLGQGRTPIVRELWDFDWVVCIYLQGSKKEDKNEYDIEANRIRGTNMDESELFLQLAQDITVFKRSPMHLTFCSESDENSSQSIQQQEARFMWSQLLLETILHIPRPPSNIEAYKEVIDESRLCYRGNTKELNRIDQFSSIYTPDQAIYWYTLDAFLYRVLNRALRTQNIIVIYKFRFILQDIYRQLNDLYKAQQSKRVEGMGKSLLVYHGQMITPDELSNFRRNIGKTVAMNSFLSMTPDKEMALGFAGFGQQRPRLESVVFEASLPTTFIFDVAPFADVTQLSAMPDEQEVLLSIGSVMKIESIENDLNNNVVWIRFSLCSHESTRFAELKNFSQLPLANPKKDEISLISHLVCLLEHMGESEKAMYMAQLAKRRAADLGIDDPVTNFANAIRQFSQFPVRECGSQKAMSYANEMNTSLDAMMNRYGHVLPQIQPLFTLMKDILRPVADIGNQITSGRSLDELPHSSCDEDLFGNMIGHTRDALKPLMPWLESIVPAEHPMRSQFSLLQSVQNEETSTANTTSIEQMQSALKQLEESSGSNNPLRCHHLRMMAMKAERMNDDEKALDFYMQVLDVHDPSLQRHVQTQRDTNLKIAGMLEKRGDLEAACEFYTNVINIPQLPPDSSERYQALRARARLYEKCCKWRASLDDYLYIRELEQRYPSISYNLSFYDDIIIAELQEKLQENNSNE